jgi:FkbM family methyltransferase
MAHPLFPAPLSRLLNKPHYVYRPRQALRRVAAIARSPGLDETVVQTLPWTAPIECWPADAIGSSIVRTGIYDLLASEALFRLTDPGDVAVDAGANIGHMTCVLATAAGPRGRVLSFEPHPEVVAVLDRNVRRWRLDPRMASIETYSFGLSDHHGRATMVMPADFARNRGTSRVVDSVVARSERATRINLGRLDEIVSGPVGVLKLDVEGHEPAVLDGAARLLVAGAVRDVVFEEVDPYPTAVTRRLEAYDFEVRELVQELHGPKLVAPGTGGKRGSWDPPVLVASRHPARLERRFAARGWWALRRRAR